MMRPKILPLTSARFFAALYVMIGHAIIQLRLPPNLFVRTVGIGFVAVSFFFMLSGFILAIVYLAGDEPIDSGRFFVHRFARIYPVYFAAFLLEMPHYLYTHYQAIHSGSMQALVSIAATLGLMQAWFPEHTDINFPSWSLSAEAFFYLLFPLLGAALWRLKGWGNVWMGVLLYGVTVYTSTFMDGARKYNPAAYLPVFLLGILLARLYGELMRRPESAERLSASAPLLVAGSLLLFMCIPVFRLPVSDSELSHGVLAPIFGVIILALASGNRMLHSILSVEWLVVLGDASYALYLLHVPVSYIFRRFIENYQTPGFIVYIAVTIGLSVISLKWFETPTRRWLLRHWSRHKHTEASTPVFTR
jgi:peptidoglycan/LPS O-acetylase OafA/YrhL